ncbi:MAG: S8 family serine peptidase [Anaerolineae bacterium]|nr:S8 family serine peptidase [Anaerolineae bacterium]
MKVMFSKLLAIVAVLAMVLPISALASPNAPQALDVGAELVTPVKEEATTYIVYFDKPALPSYKGDIAGLKATSIASTGAQKLDLNSSASRTYRTHLINEQAQFLMNTAEVLGRQVEVLFQYQLAINGMAIKVNAAEANKIAQLDGVMAIVPDWEEYEQTDHGPWWINADQLWDGSAMTGMSVPGTKGEGIIVAVFDSGINTDHPSFADIGGDGYDHENPLGTGNYLGFCHPSHERYDEVAGLCNDKVIGLWSGDEDPVEDYRGHGSGMAAIAVGNVLTAVVHSVNDPTAVVTRNISGVAPHANLVSYNIENVLGTGSASVAVVVAACEQAIADQVDMINYSYGGGTATPWLAAQHWLNIYAAGILAVTGSSNSGPGFATVENPGAAPWIFTTGNTSHNRMLKVQLTGMSGLDDITGKAFSRGYGPAPIVYAGWYSGTVIPDPNSTFTITMDYDTARLCLYPFPAGTFNGEIVICDRGQNARTDKGANVLAGGAGGYVLANAEADSASLNGDAHFLPAIHITYEDGVALKTWLGDGPSTPPLTGTLSGVIMDVNDAYGDIVVSSSGRGPNNPLAQDVIKPDVTSPGLDILTADQTDHNNPTSYPEFDFGTGVSPATPHVIGLAAMLKVVHPEWTAGQLRAALMTTAVNHDTILKEDGATPADPFDYGAGRIDGARAVRAGLVLDETAANYQAANPAVGGDPTTLNIPSFGNAQCAGMCQWTRTLKSSLTMTETWTLVADDTSGMALSFDPVTFTLAPGATQKVVVTANVVGLPTDAWLFGGITFTPASTTTVSAYFPVAVQPAFSRVPASVVEDTARGSSTISVQSSISVTDLTLRAYGLTQATLTEEYVHEDLTNGNLFDGFGNPISGTFFVTVTTPITVGTHARLVAEVITTTSPDLDMFIIADYNSDGSLNAYACQSATGATLEYCSISASDLVTNTTYYILIQNFTSSRVMSGTVMLPDRVILATALVPAEDVGNMTLTGPASVNAGEVFDIVVRWNVSALARQLQATDAEVPHWYGAFDIGTSATTPDDLGFVEVDIAATPSAMSYIYLPLVVKY